MRGGERRRYCSHCRKAVHNLSEMTAREMEGLLERVNGGLCATYESDARGQMVKHTSDHVLARLFLKTRKALTAILAALLPWVAASCTSFRTTSAPCAAGGGEGKKALSHQGSREAESTQAGPLGDGN